jgi:hypothetical protein
MSGPTRFMPTAITYDQPTNALVADLASQKSYEELLQTTRCLATELQRRSCTKLYVDARHTELHLTALQAFHLAVACADQVPRGLHVAVTVRPAQRLLTELAQVAARLRGVVLEMFESPQEARGWLA